MIEEIERKEIYDFLEHVGVKGMRWGQRKAKTSEQKKITRDKVLKTVEIAGVVGMGAIVANHLIKKHHATKLKDIDKVTSKLATPFLAKYGNTPSTVWHQPGPFQTSKHLGFLRKAPKAYDYGYKLPTVDIGPSGLAGWRFPTGPK